MSVFFQCPSIIIDQGIIAPGHGKEVFDGLNAIEKRYMYQIMSNVQLPGSRNFDSQIIMYSCTPKNDVSLAKEFQNNMSKENCKYGVIYQGNTGKDTVKKKNIQRVSCSG